MWDRDPFKDHKDALNTTLVSLDMLQRALRFLELSCDY
jgi:hypothetical protein